VGLVGVVVRCEILAGDERWVVLLAAAGGPYLPIVCWTTAVIASGENGLVM